MSQIDKPTLRDLFSHNKIKELFHYLNQLEYPAYTDYQNDYMEIKSRWNRMEKENRAGTIRREDYELENNRLTASLRFFIDDLPDDLFSSQAQSPQANSPSQIQSSSTKKLPVPLIIIVTLVILIGGGIVTWVNFSDKKPVAKNPENTTDDTTTVVVASPSTISTSKKAEIIEEKKTEPAPVKKTPVSYFNPSSSYPIGVVYKSKNKANSQFASSVSQLMKAKGLKASNQVVKSSFISSGTFDKVMGGDYSSIKHGTSPKYLMLVNQGEVETQEGSSSTSISAPFEVVIINLSSQEVVYSWTPVLKESGAIKTNPEAILNKKLIGFLKSKKMDLP
ncbi:hypothetical protein R9C00_02390 [Flammeovirgaceae bacterium SG7u.111]|nr:hypothetical protein [Flammeovirgaceae bacterium SG7u.132]WPO36290.1 hypothetical protein R9C00_02390 [Flammeovirgaceae bacterium SG7u.111]